MTFLFPGSFDPFTLGHYDIVQRILPICSKVVIAIGDNIGKKGLFSVEEREILLQILFSEELKNNTVEVHRYSGLTVDFCKEKNIRHIVRGLRNTGNFEFEQALADANWRLNNVETILLITRAEYTQISSTVVRDILAHSDKIGQFVPNHHEYIAKLTALAQQKKK